MCTWYSLPCLSAMENQVINTFSPASQPREQIFSICKSLPTSSKYICQESRKIVSAFKDQSPTILRWEIATVLLLADWLICSLLLKNRVLAAITVADTSNVIGEKLNKVCKGDLDIEGCVKDDKSKILTTDPSDHSFYVDWYRKVCYCHQYKGVNDLTPSF